MRYRWFVQQLACYVAVIVGVVVVIVAVGVIAVDCAPFIVLTFFIVTFVVGRCVLVVRISWRIGAGQVNELIQLAAQVVYFG